MYFLHTCTSDVPQVTNLRLEMVSDTTIQLSWQQDDPCRQTESFLIKITDSDLTEPPLKKTINTDGQSSPYSAQLNLPHSQQTGCTVSLSAIDGHGRMSGVTTSK